MAFAYDTLGNLTNRGNNDTGLSESFTYDALDRLVSSTITGSPAKSFSYDPIGNLIAKSDVGTSTYPVAGSSQPHAVVSISGDEFSATFTCDADGNQTAGLGRTIGYTSFNKPASITQGAINVAFTHDIEHQRLKKIDVNGGSTTTTLYLSAGPVYAEEVIGGEGPRPPGTSI